MKTLRNIIFTSFLLFFALKISAQTDSVFTVNNFPENLTQYFNSGEKEFSEDKIDSIVADYTVFWNELTFPEKENIVYVSNYLSERNVKKSETFFYFIKTAQLLKPKSSDSYSKWLKLLVLYSNPEFYSTREIKSYIEQIYMFSLENCVFWSKSVKWKYNSGTYNFILNEEQKKLNIQFNSVNLECIYYEQDTISITSTGGHYDILANLWTGKSGKVNWLKYKMPENQVYAKLNNYKINLTNAKYTADSVTFKNSAFMKTEILGSIEDEASSWGKKNKAFPKFVSYKTDFDGYSGNIHFMSGITMRGPAVVYSGTAENDAVIEYIVKGKKYFKAESENFYTTAGHTTSSGAKIDIFIAKQDTIRHPQAKIDIYDEIFEITGTSEGAGNLPFYDTYQNVEINVDNIYWKTSDSLIYFLSEDNKGKFVKSANYFTSEDFEKQKMYETINPLFEIKRFTKLKNSNTFFADEYAKFAKKEPAATRQRFIGLWYDGFVDYNTETNEVTVLPKLLNYIEYFFERKDYDVINIQTFGKSHQIKSIYGIMNCVFSRNTNNLTIFGVPNVILSEKKLTGFVPSSNTVVMKENRKMIFSGRVKSGLLDIMGQNFTFDYEKFEIKFTNADTFLYTVISKQYSEDYSQTVTLNSIIENVSGKIRIDLSTNKSSIKEIPKFPTVTSSDTSFVFYDKNKVYDRKTFMFKTYPFVKDSLLYIGENKIKIKGKMLPGGILPEFEEYLRVQDDYSLGFIHKTPEEGLKLFGGKTTLSSKESSFTSAIKLSNRGLEANGVANWYNTTIISQNFKLYPDSLSALADNIEIKRDTTNSGFKYPDVKGKLIYSKWDSKEDYISYTTTQDPVEMYQGKVKLTGTLIYRPNALEGNCSVNMDKGTLKSEKFKFNDNSFSAEKTNMNIKDNTEDKINLKITDVKSYVDINAQKGVFAANSDSSKIEFADNKYVNYPNHFVWNSNSNDVDIDYSLAKHTATNNPADLDSAYLVDVCKFDKSIFNETEGISKFVSADSDQKGLTFYGTKADYNAETGEITSKSVKKIIVADIEVTPTDDVKINKDGKIGKLTNTTVKARGRHNIDAVDINIMSREQYEASSGTYIYYDQNKTSQNIKFDKITYDPQVGATVAHGFVEQFQKFTLNPYFDYYGEVFFNAKNDFLKFKGYARIIHTCNSKPFWFEFESEINPDSVYLPLNQNLNSDLTLNKARIFADFLISPDSSGLFASFMSTDPSGIAESVFSMRSDKNFIRFNQDKSRYEIASLQKFADRNSPGNYMELDTKNCIITGEGKFNYTDNLRIDSVGGYGEFRYDMNSKSFRLNSVSYISFFYNNKAAQIISDKINANFEAAGVNLTENTYIKNMNNILGASGTKNLTEDLSLNSGKPKNFPEILNKPLIFSDLKLEWNQKSNSFKSQGKIGVGNLYKNMHNKYLNGYVEIRKDYNAGDQIYVYLEPAANQWVFFSFSGGIMRTYSSENEYNQLIESLKENERKIRNSKGIYNFMLTNKEAVEGFIFEFTGKHPALQNNSGESSNNSENINFDE